jgi:class 3 adenylate cyclase/tetratricopeptide (TPR) repeat protein
MATCARCGAENPDGFRFCGSCGAALQEAPPAQEARKTVTVVFCDVSGSTAIGERLDPESLRRVMALYFNAMRTAVERHGGAVEKFIGDAVMAVFGVPVLHEDDALRAVRAAAEMRDRVRELNSELVSGYGTTLEVRIGVNTGEVVTGTSERLVTGDAVNVAARLEQAARPGEILLGEETVQLARGAIVTEELPPLELKGKTEGVPAHRLVSVSADAPGVARRFDTPMVGRERERRLLLDAWERVVSERSCVLFTLLGVAGVGKSRLVADVRARIDARVVEGRCLSYGEGITYWPVVEIVKQLPTAAELGVDAAAQAALATLLGESDLPTTSDQIAWAVRKVLEAAAAERPLLVLLDDVHWGEPAFLDLVRHVADLSRGAPILLVCIARPELLERAHGWGGGMLRATTVLLEPLSAPEIDQLMESLAGDELEPMLRARIRTAADGNPFFVEEMVSLATVDGGADVTVPPSIHALLAARLDQLDPAERDLLARGSVEGQVFHLGGVRALAPDEPAPELRVTALVRKELVRPEQPTLPAEEAYRFRHLLIRDAAYDALPKATRAELHERFADWLDARASNLVEREEIVGYHLEQAHRYRSELGPLGDAEHELGRRAARYLASSGRTAIGRGDHRAAAGLLARSLTLLHAEDPARSRVLMDLAGAQMELGEMAGARKSLDAGLAAAHALGDESALGVGRLHSFLLDAMTNPSADTRRELVEIEAMIDGFGELADDATLALAWSARARAQFFLGHAGLAEESYGRAVEYARRARDFRLESEALQWWAGAKRFGPAPAEDALAFLAGLDEIAQRDGSVDGYRKGFASVLLAMQGRFREAVEELHEGIRWARELGHQHRRLGTAMEGGYVEVLAGNPEAAVERLREGFDGLGELGETGYRSTIGTLLAQTLVDLGRDDEAEPILVECEAIAQKDDFDPQGRLRQVRARILARRGELAEAERLARAAVAIYGDTDYLDIHAQSLVTLAEVVSSSGKTSEAADHLAEAIELFERKGNLVLAARTRHRLDALRQHA